MNNEQHSDEEVDVNMTPMLDIVFIMLIFFIVTAVFVKEAGIEVQRPRADTGEEVSRLAAVIGISDTNEIWIDKELVQLDEVRTIVSRIKQENPKGRFVVKADTHADAALVVQVVEQLNLMNINGVSIATLTEDPS